MNTAVAGKMTMSDDACVGIITYPALLLYVCVCCRPIISRRQSTTSTFNTRYVHRCYRSTSHRLPTSWILLLFLLYEFHCWLPHHWVYRRSSRGRSYRTGLKILLYNGVLDLILCFLYFLHLPPFLPCAILVVICDIYSVYHTKCFFFAMDGAAVSASIPFPCGQLLGSFFFLFTREILSSIVQQAVSASIINYHTRTSTRM